ncbi:TetR/AcrR family transcriptional regulator [Actinomycetospora aeridis]|uniref:TetR family transcriptional regulator n=1 Tax=Actinomycetospora aeridis TaxID=3129231 RepID=A0ABU8NCL0_9PSEU
MPSRPRDATATRGAILDAGRAQFARDGFERVTIRSVAAEAGVDPAMVMRYFTNKAGLFTEAAALELVLPDLRGLGPDAIADALVDRFFALFEESPTLLVLLRAAATSPEAAERLLGVLLEQAGPALATAAVDRPAERAALVGSQILGFAFVRLVLGAPALAAMSREDVRAWVGPTLARYLTDPDLGP